MATATANETSGYVSADAVYTLPEVKRRLGLGAAALRSARRDGLVIRRIGRRGYVLGRDLLAFIEHAGQ